jgi:uncharacterized protein DUF547
VAVSVSALTACKRSDEREAAAPLVAVRAGLDHSAWDDLLSRYVDHRNLVGYERWKTSPEDLSALRAYIAGLAAPATPPAAGEDRTASLINAYNALTIQWIIDNYPTRSIRSLDHSFSARRHTVGGRKVSLDDIEHATLRPLAGYRVHGAVVCAARSCPPLRREAYTASRLDQQLDRAMREWMDREDLNRFDLERKRAEISSLFKWFAEDFEKAGGLRSVLKKHTRGDVPRMLDNPDLKIDYLPFHWGLNDQGGLGESYGGLQAIRDRLKGS